MKNIIRYIQRIFENLIIQIITTLLIFTSGIYVFRDKFFYVLTRSIPIWLAFFFSICALIVGYLIQHLRRKKAISFAIGRFTTGREIEKPFDLYGVNWIAYVPNSFPYIPEPFPSFKKDEHVWIEGPFCPKCNLILSWKEGFLGIRYYWLCERCNERYARPRKKKHEMIELVENICFSDIFRKNIFKRENQIRE